MEENEQRFREQWGNVKGSSPYYRDKSSPLTHHSYRRRKWRWQDLSSATEDALNSGLEELLEILRNSGNKRAERMRSNICV